MKKFFMPVKGFVSFLLICSIMLGIVFSDFTGSMRVKGAEVGISLLYVALMEALTASLGYSYSSETDLTAGGSALESVVSSAAQYVEDGFTSYNDLSSDVRATTTLWAFELALQMQGVSSYGDTVSLSSNALEGLQEWVYDLLSDKVVASSDSITTGSVKYNISTTRVEEFTASNILSFIRQKYPIISATNSNTLAAVETMSNFNFIAISPRYTDTGVLNQIYVYFCNAINGSHFLYYDSGGVKLGSANYKDLAYSYCYSNGFTSNSEVYLQGRSNRYISLSDCYILMENSVRVYSSYAAYVNEQNASVYAPSSTIYGSSDAAKDLTETDDGTVSIPLVEPYITQQVVSAVTDAITENPDATDEDINAKIIELIAGINDVKDITGDIAEDTDTIIGLLNSVLVNLKSIGKSIDTLVDEISVSGGAGVLDWTDIEDAFAEEEVSVTTGGESDNENDNDEDEKFSLTPWIPGTIVTTGLVAPLVKHFSEPLSLITRYLDEVEEWIMDVPQTLDDAIATPVQGVIDAVADLPADIVTGLSEELELEVYNPLDEILDILNDLLVIDASQILDALGEFEVVWESKFSFLDDLAALFDWTFPTEYVYPQIKIRTPAIFVNNEFYTDEYIILCDFADFKTQCQYARGIAKAVLWFAFALSVFKQFKVIFHIG